MTSGIIQSPAIAPPISRARAGVVVLFLLCGVVCNAVRAELEVAEISIITADGTINYQTELANDTYSRTQGLMHRQSMPANRAMLLHFGRPQHVSIWMKNTLIPLDILYIDKAGIIVRIVEYATPLSLKSMPSGKKVVAVLELNAGQVAAHRIKTGDKVINF
ncbi:MAG: DUF192 domain-containing protein [Gammaproteobacteria bacterium]